MSGAIRNHFRLSGVCSLDVEFLLRKFRGDMHHIRIRAHPPHTRLRLRAGWYEMPVSVVNRHDERNRLNTHHSLAMYHY